MADAKEGFRWLREYQYNVDWFAVYGEQVPKTLGYLLAGGKADASEILEAAHEHAMELDIAIKKLKEIADNG